jgi:hypothetical protein
MNLVQDNIVLLSQNYKNLADSDIILIYNVLNEITSKPLDQKMVWENLKYILKLCDKSALVLLMEPAAKYTRPRVQPTIERLSAVTKYVIDPNEEEFTFDKQPLKIQYENSSDGLNVRLFGNPIDGHRPTLEKSLRRIHLACVRIPISQFDAERQFRSVTRPRDERQRFRKPREQTSFSDFDSSFGTQKATRKYLNEP